MNKDIELLRKYFPGVDLGEMEYSEEGSLNKNVNERKLYDMVDELDITPYEQVELNDAIGRVFDSYVRESKFKPVKEDYNNNPDNKYFEREEGRDRGRMF